jgi:hypothetical protein
MCHQFKTTRLIKAVEFRAWHCYSTIQTLARLARVHFTKSIPGLRPSGQPAAAQIRSRRICLCTQKLFMKKGEPKDDVHGCTSVAERMDARERQGRPDTRCFLRFSVLALRSPGSAVASGRPWPPATLIYPYMSSLRWHARRGILAAPLRAYGQNLRCSGSFNGSEKSTLAFGMRTFSSTVVQFSLCD